MSIHLPLEPGGLQLVCIMKTMHIHPLPSLHSLVLRLRSIVQQPLLKIREELLHRSSDLHFCLCFAPSACLLYLLPCTILARRGLSGYAAKPRNPRHRSFCNNDPSANHFST